MSPAKVTRDAFMRSPPGPRTQGCNEIRQVPANHVKRLIAVELEFFFCSGAFCFVTSLANCANHASDSMNDPVEDPRAHFNKGIELYQQGEHYEAHELWEDLWHHEGDEERFRFLQALIQVTSAVHKAVNNVAPRGALLLIERATDRLDGLPDVFMGIDVVELRAGMARFHGHVQEALEKSHGLQCRLSPSLAPTLVTRAAISNWVQEAEENVVPQGAQEAWFTQGLAAYRSGDFFEAHERWKDLWRHEKEEDRRQFLQALIQVAAAMQKIVNEKKPRPAAHLLERALLRLRAYPSIHENIAVGRLVAGAELARRAVTQMTEDAPIVFPPELIPKIDTDDAPTVAPVH